MTRYTNATSAAFSRRNRRNARRVGAGGHAADDLDRTADRGRFGVEARTLTGPRGVDRFGVELDVALVHATRTRGLK